MLNRESRKFMSSRFHQKYHRFNHHTEPNPDPRFPDSSHDPIASPLFPFRGQFTLNGSLSSNQTLAAPYLSAITLATSSVNITNSGTSPALSVVQTGSTDIAIFNDDTNIALIIKDGGNVGINVANPGQKLTVSGNVSATNFYGNGYFVSLSSQNVFGSISIVTPSLSAQNVFTTTLTASNTTTNSISSNTGFYSIPTTALISNSAVALPSGSHRMVELTGATPDTAIISFTNIVKGQQFTLLNSLSTDLYIIQVPGTINVRGNIDLHLAPNEACLVLGRANNAVSIW